MPVDFTRVVELLEKDVADTLGEAHRAIVGSCAGAVVRLDVADPAVKLIEDVQQSIHDTFIDTAWPVCPHYHTHPLWYADGSWWCTEDRVAVAPLGELAGVK